MKSPIETLGKNLHRLNKRLEYAQAMSSIHVQHQSIPELESQIREHQEAIKLLLQYETLKPVREAAAKQRKAEAH